MKPEKLELAYFVNSLHLVETFAMTSPEESDSAYKQSLLDTLRYLQALSQKLLIRSDLKSDILAAMHKWLSNLDLIETYFKERNNTDLVDLIKRNKAAVVIDINSGNEFTPEVWESYLNVATEKLPPKYFNISGMISNKPQYRGASAFYSNDTPLTNKIELERH